MEEMSFEQALTGLNKCVKDLEGGGLSLEETINSFEEGKRLAKKCYEMLENAELRINQLNAPEDG